jgi:hypothetical protein
LQNSFRPRCSPSQPPQVLTGGAHSPEDCTLTGRVRCAGIAVGLAIATAHRVELLRAQVGFGFTQARRVSAATQRARGEVAELPFFTRQTQEAAAHPLCAVR